MSEQTHEANENDTSENQTSDDLSLNIGGPGPGQLSREDIQESITEIVNRIEDKRKQDMKIVADVVKEIMAQAKRSCEVLEQHMLQMHAVKSKELDEELEKVFKTLDSVKQAEVELDTSRNSLKTLCQEIQKPLS